MGTGADHDLVARAYAEGRAAWPEFELDQAVFADFLQARLARRDGDESLAWADLYLVCACLAKNAVATKLLDDRVIGRVAPVVRRLNSSTEFVDEVVQLTRTKLLFDHPRSRLPDYLGKGSLFGWVKAIAVRLALTEVQRTPKERPLAPETLPEMALDGEASLELLRERHRADFVEAFQRAVATLDAQQRTVLRMSALDGLTVDHVGDVFGVHRSTAARWVSRAKAQVLEKTREALVAKLALSESDLSSFMRAMTQGLDVSLRRLL